MLKILGLTTLETRRYVWYARGFQDIKAFWRDNCILFHQGLVYENKGALN